MLFYTTPRTLLSLGRAYHALSSLNCRQRTHRLTVVPRLYTLSTAHCCNCCLSAAYADHGCPPTAYTGCDTLLRLLSLGCIRWIIMFLACIHRLRHAVTTAGPWPCTLDTLLPLDCIHLAQRRHLIADAGRTLPSPDFTHCCACCSLVVHHTQLHLQSLSCIRRL